MKERDLSRNFPFSLPVLFRKLICSWLEIRLGLQRLYGRFEKERVFESNTSTDDATANEIRASLEVSHATGLSGWLREKLRLYPYWAGGHLALARESLTLNDVATCYASCQACLALLSKGPVYHESQKVLGVCYVRSGMAEKAIKILSKEVETSKNDYRLIEELASAYLLADRRKEALATLRLVPEGKLSPESTAALSYLSRGDS